MSDLDEKLRDVLRSSDGSFSKDPDISIPAIKQIFSEDSVWKMNLHTFELDGNKLMTGQEWYERFVEELTLMPYSSEGSFVADNSNQNTVLRAAKRAARLES